MNAFYKLNSGFHGTCIEQVWSSIFSLWKHHNVSGRTRTASIFEHIFRERNKEADSLASLGIHSFGAVRHGVWMKGYGRPSCLRVFV